MLYIQVYRNLKQYSHIVGTYIFWIALTISHPGEVMMSVPQVANDHLFSQYMGVVCVCIYIYHATINTYKYLYMYVCMYVYIYMYTYNTGSTINK